LIPYNATAAQVKTRLEDDTGQYNYPSPNGLPNSTNNGIGGAGNVTCTGGPLPGTPITVTLNGLISGKQAIYGGIGSSAAISGTGNTLNNGATGVLTTLFRGAPADTTYFTPMVTAAAAALALDPDMIPVFDNAVGGNDENDGGVGTLPTTPADYANYLLSGMTYLIGLGYKCLVHAPYQMLRYPNTTWVLANDNAAGAAYPAALAALDNGTTIRYAGDAVTRGCIREPLGTTDGGHVNAALNEGTWSHIIWGINAGRIMAYGTLTPSGGGGGRRMGLGFA
jgi:hypothetical protein